MHTVETDGKNTIEEMAEAAKLRGYQYIAITDHSKNLAMANGLDDKRAVKHIARIQAPPTTKSTASPSCPALRSTSSSDGSLDLSDSVLEQMDVVVASVHSAFNQEQAQMTDRLLRAISNKNVSILGHPTGRLQLRREAYEFDFEAVLKAAGENQVAMELNAYPDRLDLNDVHLAHGARPRRQDRDQYRRPPYFALRKDQIRHLAGAPRMAHRERCPQYSSRKRIPPRHETSLADKLGDSRTL